MCFLILTLFLAKKETLIYFANAIFLITSDWKLFQAKNLLLKYIGNKMLALYFTIVLMTICDHIVSVPIPDLPHRH